MSKKKPKNNTNKNKGCETCEECLPIGDGDHICSEITGVIVISEYEPTDEYLKCGGDKYTER